MVKKLEVEFDWNTKKLSLVERKYTLTHSDVTGQRYLYVGPHFAEDRCNKLKDEVLGAWVELDARFELHIKCTLYSESSSLTIEERYKKFKEHMPRAITAIINGDKEYVVQSNLVNENVYVYFMSDSRPSKEYYGKVQDYLRES